MKEFANKLAVVTGAATGMGRELALQLSAEGCDVALCDVNMEVLEQTAAACRNNGVEASAHHCDVSDETQVLAFQEQVSAAHNSHHIHLLFNNAGIGGGGSFVKDRREDWERCFGVCWFGVYHCSRAFLPMLIAADEARIVNTSSINGFWASLGPHVSHTAYSAAKFAVKGFSEALINDLRLNAPHVSVSVVMPGHIGTDIQRNSIKALGKGEPLSLEASEVESIRARMVARGLPVDNLPDDAIRGLLEERAQNFKTSAPVNAAQAATVILSGVKDGQWRILVGADAYALDELVRANPQAAYDPEFIDSLVADGHLAGAVSPR